VLFSHSLHCLTKLCDVLREPTLTDNILCCFHTAYTAGQTQMGQWLKSGSRWPQETE